MPSEKENKRKCFKCGRSPFADNVKLFRFPKPGINNLIRCELWAQYMFPEGEYSSTAFQMKLHNEHRMLCGEHFLHAEFTDDTLQKLRRCAVPSDTEHRLPIFSMEPQPGPSRGVLQEVTNTIDIAQPGPSRGVLQVTSILHRVESNIGTASDAYTQTVDNTNQPVKSEREKFLYAKCSKHMRKICQLRNRIKHLKTRDILKHVSDDVSVNKLSEKISPTFAQLLQGQIRNFKKKSTGRRWNKKEKITALRIYKRSPTCYRLLRRLFQLPSPSTLKSLLNRVPFGVGINQPVFEVLKNYTKTQKPSDNEYMLMFDEMSIKKHLNYNPKEDMIEGFQDHASQGRSSHIAAYALVFMIAGIRKKVKQPIAHYFSSGFSTADRLAVLIKEVLKMCFDIGVHIAAIVCDMDGVNRRALTILGASLQHPYISFQNKEIIAIFDVPHLLKCFRNLFMKYDIECATDISSNDKAGKGIAKWSHIKDFYEMDNTNPNFVYAPILKKDHLNPNSKQKMKVKLAAQVLSHSVAGGMLAKISNGELTAEATVTANVIINMDKLFDCLNSDCSDLRRGKAHATNLKNSSPHLKCFEKMKQFFTNMKYIGSPRKPPSQEGWIWTINAIERLWRTLVQKHHITSLATRRLQQDPIENLFGCIRGNCGSNSNPTCNQFVAGLKTAILTNLSHIGTTGNCETDNSVIINNFETLLSVSQPAIVTTEPELLTSIELPQIDDAINENSSEIQACAYVCGFLIKKIPNDCENCKNGLLSGTVENFHLFVECREYSDYKNSLNYVTKDMVACVEHCATIINNFLQEKAHTTCMKKVVTENIKASVNFDFLNRCMEHKDQNICTIINSVFMICIRRYCVLKNRLFADEASAAALKRKMNIILHV